MAPPDGLGCGLVTGFSVECLATGKLVGALLTGFLVLCLGLNVGGLCTGTAENIFVGSMLEIRDEAAVGQALGIFDGIGVGVALGEADEKVVDTRLGVNEGVADGTSKAITTKINTNQRSTYFSVSVSNPRILV